jgi:N-acetylneuraminate synthase
MEQLNNPVKIIGEIGINHNGFLDVAMDLINTANLAGFDYVKFQKRDIDLCIPEHKKNEKKILWDGSETTYYDYKDRIEFDFDEYAHISAFCEGKIKWFASVWDMESAKMMREFTNIVKIPSALVTDLDLIAYCRDHFQTLIISTGMCTEQDIKSAERIGEPDVIMHCNSSYPAKLDELNLNYINWLKEKYPNRSIGYSGHEINLQPTICAVSMGAEWIERHITIDRHSWGSDQLSSVEPVGMYKLVKAIRDIEKALGKAEPRKIYESEKSKLKDLRPDFVTL